MAHKLIIDADPGIGDALAIALAMLDPQIDVVAITATGGCVSGEAATRNVQAIVEHLDPVRWPRVGASEADAPLPRWEDAVVLNGPTGLGEGEWAVADLHHPREAAKLMTDLVRDAPHEITLLTLGPLTNVAVACERTPEFLSLLNGLVCLGGSLNFGGNVTAAAEFNIFANPQAARHVLLSPATKTLIPLDTSSKVVLTFDRFHRLPRDSTTPIGSFFERLLSYSLRAYHERLGQEGIRLHEIVALAAIAEPQHFERQTVALEVETAGDVTRGMTVFDRRGVPQWQTNIDVLTTVDAHGVLDYMNRVLQRALAAS